MSAESLGPGVDDVNERWNQLLTGIADREVTPNSLFLIIIGWRCNRQPLLLVFLS